MTINGYQKAALRTEAVSDIAIFQYTGKAREQRRLLNGLMGLCGEAGECIDILKKYLHQEHGLDKKHLAKELGDVAWYLAVSADALGYSLEDIMAMNVEKLNERYPDGFDAEKSKNRKDGDI